MFFIYSRDGNNLFFLTLNVFSFFKQGPRCKSEKHSESNKAYQITYKAI